MEELTNWMLSFGKEYGVNPIIFALLYFGTIPFSLLSFGWLVKNYRLGKSILLPLLILFTCFIGTYVYLFAVGHDIPIWVYGLALIVMSYSAYVSVRKIRQATRPR